MHKRLSKWEPHIHAFVTLEETADHPHIGPLAGVTVGVKDIIDVVGLPTRNGSKSCANALPATQDAAVVKTLRAAGAQIVGKTTTTEFAFTDPTNCRNPYDTHRSPGGSSSGSGAAVAAGLVDVALGTQTAGSLCRPAAYCGVVGFKPTYCVLPNDGVTPLAPSFDSVGIIAGSVELAQRCFAVMSADRFDPVPVQPEDCVAVQTLLDRDVTPSVEMQSAFQDASKALATLGSKMSDESHDLDVERIVRNHRTVMNYEAAIAHAALLSEGAQSLLQPKFLTGLRAGAQTSRTEAEEAMQALAIARNHFWKQLQDIDIVLTLPVPDAAPLIDGTTGFQDWLTPWTVFGGPLLCLPWGLSSQGCPLSVMLAGHPGQDLTVLSVAAALEKRAPTMPRPILPQG